MENTTSKYTQKDRYLKAKKRLKAITGFYWHLFFYLLINIALLFFGNSDFKNNGFLNWQNYSTAFFWGIGLFFHWFGVFGKNLLFSKRWEERKIKEIMEKEQRHL